MTLITFDPLTLNYMEKTTLDLGWGDTFDLPPKAGILKSYSTFDSPPTTIPAASRKSVKSILDGIGKKTDPHKKDPIQGTTPSTEPAPRGEEWGDTFINKTIMTSDGRPVTVVLTTKNIPASNPNSVQSQLERLQNRHQG